LAFEQPERPVGKQTDGQGRNPALYFPAHPELLRAKNCGGSGAEPPRDNLPAFDIPGCCGAAARCSGRAKPRAYPEGSAGNGTPGLGVDWATAGDYWEQVTGLSK